MLIRYTTTDMVILSDTLVNPGILAGELSAATTYWSTVSKEQSNDDSISRDNKERELSHVET